MYFHGFGATRWRKPDHDVPLRLRTSRCHAQLFISEDAHKIRDLIVMPVGRMELIYDPAPSELLASLASRGTAAAHAAEVVYASYREAHEQFEALLYSAGRVRYLAPMGPESISGFFESSFGSEKVEWSVDGERFRAFEPKLKKPRGRNPLYKIDQLVTPARWAEMQKRANDGGYPTGDLLELYRIRGKIGWRQAKTAAIEASIISESLLREYAVAVLKKGGFSNNKLKRLRDELTFNNLLNIVLPLSLKRRDLKSMQSSIDAVDRLRGIRNDLVHGNMLARDVESDAVEEGIDGALKVVRFLKSQLDA